MKEFNENPFLKDTPVQPFSNGTEFMQWQNTNCMECKEYEDESQDEDSANCKLAFHLDMGTVIGTIPLWVAKDIGCKYDPLYQSCRLNNRCSKMVSKNSDFPF